MTNSIVSVQAESLESPFESIRHFDDKGIEFWKGRELQKILGYTKWENFEKTILRAIAACKNSVGDESKHFRSVRKKGTGRDFQDYQLSRHACYLVAMNGDPEKNEIAQAQSYFATKTREAEVVVPALSEKLEIARLENESLKLQIELQSRQDTRIALHGLTTTLLLEGKSDAVVEVDKPTLEVIDRRNNTSYSGQTLTQIKDFIAKKHGIKFKTGADIKRVLEQKKLGHLIAQTPRSVLSDYIPTENQQEAYDALIGISTRQMLLGE